MEWLTAKVGHKPERSNRLLSTCGIIGSVLTTMIFPTLRDQMRQQFGEFFGLLQGQLFLETVS
jgi:hypothetical protein